MERRIFVSSDYRPQLLAGTWEKKRTGSMPSLVTGIFRAALGRQWRNVEVFWLLLASLLRRQTCRTETLHRKSAVDTKVTGLSLGTGQGTEISS